MGPPVSLTDPAAPVQNPWKTRNGLYAWLRFIIRRCFFRL